MNCYLSLKSAADTGLKVIMFFQVSEFLRARCALQGCVAVGESTRPGDDIAVGKGVAGEPGELRVVG